MQEEGMKFDVKGVPPPTVPPISWAEARADYKRGPVVSGPEDVVAISSSISVGSETRLS